MSLFEPQCLTSTRLVRRRRRRKESSAFYGKGEGGSDVKITFGDDPDGTADVETVTGGLPSDFISTLTALHKSIQSICIDFPSSL